MNLSDIVNDPVETNDIKDYIRAEEIKKENEKRRREAELQKKLALATTREEVEKAKFELNSMNSGDNDEPTEKEASATLASNSSKINSLNSLNSPRE